MFGYVVVNVRELDKEQFERYRSRYCGVCAALRERAGIRGTLALQYDLVFLSLVLSSLYEPEETRSVCSCPRHPVKGVPVLAGDAVSYAADMGILLSYLKFDDDVRDGDRAGAGLLRSALKKGYETVCGSYPEQAASITSRLEAMDRLEQQNGPVEELMNRFGELMGDLFAWRREDFWASYLYSFGRALGRYLYLLDACLDLEKDQKKGCFNPLAGSEQETDAWQSAALAGELANVAESFEMLPLVRDADLLKNIVYSGITAAVPARLRPQEEK